MKEKIEKCSKRAMILPTKRGIYMKGKVIRFNKKKGFGFIKTADDKDVFFHYSELIMEGFKDIAVDSEVEFDVEETPKGLRASKIKKLD